MKTTIRKTRRPSRVTQAFTLIELLVVIVILAILAAVVIPRVTHRVDDARISKTASDIKSIEDALEQYKLDVGTYPTGDQGLQALVTNVGNEPKWNKPYIGSLPADGWGHPYIYKFPSEHGGEFDIESAGPDGQPGTDDDMANWKK